MCQHLAEGGILCYISSNQFTSSEYGRLMRKFLIDNKLLSRVVDFGDLPVFEKAITYVSIFTICKGDRNSFEYYQVPCLPFEIPDKFNICKYSEFTEEPWSFVFDEKKQLLQKLSSFPLITEIAFAKGGIISGCDECYLFAPNVFPAEEQLSLNVIRTEDIGRYYMRVPNLKVFYPCKLDTEGNTIVMDLQEIRDNYPLAYQHIMKNESAMKNRKDSRNTMGDRAHWYQPVRFGTRKLFDGEKIVGPGIVCKNKFSIDESGYAFSFGNMYAIVAKENKNIQMRVLLGILNSKLIEFYLHSIAPIKQGGYFSYGATILEKIPLVYPSNAIEQKIKDLVDAILSSKKQNPNADTSNEENAIDQLVYDLYGLDENERQIVENG